MASVGSERHPEVSSAPAGAHGSRDGQPTALLPEEQVPDPNHALPAPGQTTGYQSSRPAPPPTSRTGSWIRTILVVLVIALAVGAAVWKVRSNRAEQNDQAARMAAAADRPVPVSITAVQQRAMPIYLTALGTVTAYYNALQPDSYTHGCI